MYTSKEFQAATDARMHLAAVMQAIETAPNAGVRVGLMTALSDALDDLERATGLLCGQLGHERAIEITL